MADLRVGDKPTTITIAIGEENEDHHLPAVFTIHIEGRDPESFELCLNDGSVASMAARNVLVDLGYIGLAMHVAPDMALRSMDDVVEALRGPSDPDFTA